MRVLQRQVIWRTVYLSVQEEQQEENKCQANKSTDEWKVVMGKWLITHHKKCVQ